MNILSVLRAQLANSLIVMVMYYAAARLGLVLCDPVTKITLFWPATGIAVAALWRFGFGCWPGIYIAVALAEWTVAHAWPVALSIGVTNTLGPVLAVWLMRRGNFEPTFARRRDAGIFCAAALAGMSVTAGGGALNLCLNGRIPWSVFLPAGFRWWLGDSGGVLLAGVFVLAISRRQLIELRKRWMEFVALAGISILGGWLVLRQPGLSPVGVIEISFITTPAVVWGAMRLGILGASFAPLGLSLMAAAVTAMGRGPFFMPDMQQGTLLLWAYGVANISIGLMTTALLAERARAELALLESEARLRLFIEHAPAALAMFNDQMRYLAFSRRWMSDYGLEGRDIIGRSHYEIFPEIPESWKEVHRRGLAGETLRADEDCFVRHDGGRQWLRWEVRPWHRANGVVGGIIIFAEDITSRKQMESTLQERELRLRTIIATEPECVKLLDSDGALLDMNPAGLRMIQADSLEQVQNRCVYPLVVEQHRAAFRELTAKIFQGGTGMMEFQIVGLKGGRAWMETHAAPLRDAQGQVVCMLAVARDITARRQLEEQLRQSQKMEAVGQLAGGVAHDFNNILTSIIMQLELLEENPALDQDTRAGLKEVDQAARRAAELTRQLLLFGRRSVMQLGAMRLNDVLADMHKMLRRLLGEQIIFEESGETDLPPIQADRSMIEQVIVNLCVNARDAMPEGGRIALRTALVTVDATTAGSHVGIRAGQFVRLSVSDTGCGMDAATRQRIFEPFFTTKEIGKGTGLGLATVHGIVEQHQGWIEVDSAVGGGTTFRVFLPVVVIAASDPFAPSAAAETPRGHETILLVEDEASVRKVLGNFLRRCGYQVMEAADGAAAVQLWQQHSFAIDLLYSDMVMPGRLTGLDLAKQLRADKPGLKVIISSGYSAELVQSGAAALPGVTFLPKPCAPPDLARVVRSCLESKN